MSKTAVVICPGRGAYGAKELGYLARHHPDHVSPPELTERRALAGLPSIAELDAAPGTKASLHGRGVNAGPLIHACAFADFLAIDREAVEILAVGGNSMGFYTALACAGALSAEDGAALVERMAEWMDAASIGEQLIDCVCDEEWRPDPERRAGVARAIRDISSREGCALELSIDLGGLIALGGTRAAIDAYLERAPAGVAGFPRRLPGHAAFHTSLQQPVAEKAHGQLASAMLRQPELPLIDGKGRIHRPRSTHPSALWDYTVGVQVIEPFRFDRTIEVAAKEFAPDVFVLLGPGEGLAASIAQSLIRFAWRGLENKTEFLARQEREPVLLALADERHRGSVVLGAGERR